MQAPILLIHYGNSSYLPYVIQVARRFNPSKEIVFLGDEQNAYLKALGVSHYAFQDYDDSVELEQFDHLYPRIVNPSYPKYKWANFVLRRWFMLKNFIQQHGIQQFWTFDSDNFILTDLASYESRFAAYDCTSQCQGRCMNGFVSSQAIVQKYVQKINELLERESYIESWQHQYQENPELFYNEMEAFAVFVEEEGVRNYHLAQICNGTAFEDSITYVHDGMEMYEDKIKDRLVKKLYMSQGHVYCKHLASQSFIRMNNLNLSWMPKYIFPLLYGYLLSKSTVQDHVELDLLKAPWSYHAKFFIRKQIPKRIRDRLSRGAYWV